MPFTTWREAAEALKRRTGPPTPMQFRMARAAGITIGRSLPQLVADARLQSAITHDLRLSRLPRFRGVRGYPIMESQAERIKELSTPNDGPSDMPQEAHEAEAWIQHLSLKRRLKAIVRLKINAGDLVERVGGGVFEVASIREDGRINFRGGRGSGAWPDELKIKYRSGDRSAAAVQCRSEAANSAVERAQRAGWSLANAKELEPYLVRQAITEDDVAELEKCINGAKDEAPIQDFLARKPHILGSLPGGAERYCIAKKKLGSEYVPDFLICHADSSGVHWTLVELETPTSSVTITSSNQLERHAREGLAQIGDWRRWLESNIAYARAPRQKQGLGLIDIAPSAPAIVLVGRRELLLDNSEAVRRTIKDENNVEVHTFDWLLEHLRGILHFSGPPGSNPYLLHPPERAQNAASDSSALRDLF